MQSLAPSKLKPRLMASDNGDLFVYINIGKDEVFEKLPPLETPFEAQTYINMLVPKMVKRYYKNKRNRDKSRRKV